MEINDGMRIEVNPTRIGELGVGTFVILAGGILYLLSCIIGATLKKASRLYLITTLIYGSMITYLSFAKRRSRWEVNTVISDVDNLWLIHILVGTIIAAGCLAGLLAVFQFDVLSVVTAKEIETEKDRRWNGRKFLF
eukprot:scaffold693_cov200-Alexandrium_tamarense.AAC.100